jgi:hypothetical protein
LEWHLMRRLGAVGCERRLGGIDGAEDPEECGFDN